MEISPPYQKEENLAGQIRWNVWNKWIVLLIIMIYDDIGYLISFKKGYGLLCAKIPILLWFQNDVDTAIFEP